jgi:hypothetical protein
MTSPAFTPLGQPLRPSVLQWKAPQPQRALLQCRVVPLRVPCVGADVQGADRRRLRRITHRLRSHAARQCRAHEHRQSVHRPNGWECLTYDGDKNGARWRHPDATSSCSATVRYDGELLFVYSTSAPFEPTCPGEPHGYTKFRAFAVLNHDGDMSTAARAIKEGNVA